MVKLPKFKFKLRWLWRAVLLVILIILVSYYIQNRERRLEDFVVEQAQITQENSQIQQALTQETEVKTHLEEEFKKLSEAKDALAKELQDLKDQDQFKRNEQLQTDIKAIETAYLEVVKSYERLLKVKELTKETDSLDKQFTESLVLLTKRNYATASAVLKKLNQDIQAVEAKFIEKAAIPANVPVNNAAPGSGYQQQQVQTEIGNFLVNIIAGDLGSTRVIVDTASDGTCGNDCPVLSLGDYVSRNGGYAGVNGSYFCPASYPSCAGKTNSFDTLLMNKNKVYFNSDNNVYSTVPAVIFGGGWIRFVGQSSEWGRDTGIDSMIANQPLLVSGGNIAFGGDGDPKKGSKGARSFVANKGNTVYIGVVSNATVAESAYALKTLGMENALNLDSGGSTALWSGGYKFGPGRNIPNAIVFVRK